MSLTIDQLTAELGQLGDELSDPQTMLAQLGDDIVQSMKANVPVDTGALKGSIRWQTNGPNSISFEMLNYGIYQNYGVRPNASAMSMSKFWGNRFGGLTQPQFGAGYQPPRTFGLPARKFFDENEINDLIGDTFIETITNF